MQMPPPRVGYAAAVFNVLLGAAILWCAAQFVRRVHQFTLTAVAQIGLLALLALALNGLRLKIPLVLPAMVADAVAVAGPCGHAAFAAGCVAILIWSRTIVVRVATVFL